jgi:3-oxoacyl-ACP reductase-like protein
MGRHEYSDQYSDRFSARFTPASARPPDFGGRYQGLVAVVTGASAGLGAQLSVDLARAGAIVVGLARNTERLDKLRPTCAPSRRSRARSPATSPTLVACGTSSPT